MLTLDERKDFHKKIYSLSIHTCLQELFAILANMLNSVMLNVVSQSYLSATSLAGQYISIYVFTSLGLTLAVLMLVNQYYGKGDNESVKKIMNLSLVFSLVISIIFFLIAFLFPSQVMFVITNDEELITLGARYLKIFSFVFLFNAFSKIYTTILKATGNPKISTIASTFSIIINFLLSLVLIYGFITNNPLGIEGAAIASSVSALIEMLFLFLHYIIKSPVRSNIIELFKVDTFFVKEIFRYSIPTIFTKFAWSTADTLKTSIIGHMPREIIDAFTQAKLIGNIPNAILTGFGISVGIILGHELGKGNIKHAKALGDDSLKFSFRLGLVMFALTIVLNLAYFAIINPISAITPTFIIMITFFAWQYFGGSMVNNYNNGPFTAGGEVEFLAVIDIVNMWGIIVPFGMIFFYTLKLPTYFVLFFLFCNEITKILPLYNHYKKYVWARDLTKNEWFLPLEGSFIDKYKRNFKLRMNISATEFLTKRFENSTDFIFSINKNQYSEALENLQHYLEKIELDKTTAYKTVLSLEEIYVSSKNQTEKKKGEKYNFACDVGIKLKDNKIRFIYYDNGINIKNIFEDKTLEYTKYLYSIADKIEYRRIANLNKILIRINRHHKKIR